MSVLPSTLSFLWVSGRSASSQQSGSSPHWPPTKILLTPSSGCIGLTFLVWSSKGSRTPANAWVCLSRSLLRFWQKSAAVLTHDWSLHSFWGLWFSGSGQGWSFRSASWVGWSLLLFFLAQLHFWRFHRPRASLMTVLWIFQSIFCFFIALRLVVPLDFWCWWAYRRCWDHRRTYDFWWPPTLQSNISFFLPTTLSYSLPQSISPSFPPIPPDKAESPSAGLQSSSWRSTHPPRLL